MTQIDPDAVLRKKFEETHKYLSLKTEPNPWGHPTYTHSHVDAMWIGWKEGYELALSNDPDEAEAKAMCRIWGNNSTYFALACIQRGRELEQGK